MTNGEKFLKTFPDLANIERYRDKHKGTRIEFEPIWWDAEYKEPSKSEIPTSSDNLSSGLEKTRKNSKKLEKNFGESDCISRQSVAEYIDYILSHGMGKKKSFDFTKKFVASLPPVTPQESTIKNNLAVDCISRDVVKKYIQAHIHEIITESGEDKNKHINRVLRSMIHGVNCMPSAIQQPRKGHWIVTAEEYYKAINKKGGGVNENTPEFVTGIDIACSECLARYDLINNEAERFYCCPNCGADMREVVEE